MDEKKIKNDFVVNYFFLNYKRNNLKVSQFIHYWVFDSSLVYCNSLLGFLEHKFIVNTNKNEFLQSYMRLLRNYEISLIDTLYLRNFLDDVAVNNTSLLKKQKKIEIDYQLCLQYNQTLINKNFKRGLFPEQVVEQSFTYFYEYDYETYKFGDLMAAYAIFDRVHAIPCYKGEEWTEVFDIILYMNEECNKPSERLENYPEGDESKSFETHIFGGRFVELRHYGPTHISIPLVKMLTDLCAYPGNLLARTTRVFIQEPGTISLYYKSTNVQKQIYFQKMQYVYNHLCIKNFQQSLYSNQKVLALRLSKEVFEKKSGLLKYFIESNLIEDFVLKSRFILKDFNSRENAQSFATKLPYGINRLKVFNKPLYNLYLNEKSYLLREPIFTHFLKNTSGLPFDTYYSLDLVGGMNSKLNFFEQLLFNPFNLSFVILFGISLLLILVIAFIVVFFFGLLKLVVAYVQSIFWDFVLRILSKKFK